MSEYKAARFCTISGSLATPVTTKRRVISTPQVKRFATPEEIAHIEHEIPVSSGIIKLICGIANSLAFFVMGNARDKMRESGIYRNKVKYEFEKVFAMQREYDRRMLYPKGVRFFHVEDMDEELRKKYKADLTDAEYYEFWTSICGPLYDKVWPICTCLAHKYWRTMHDREMPNADACQWALAAMAVNELAVMIYANILKSHETEFNIPMFVLADVFEPFNLKNIAVAWERAIDTIFNGKYNLTPIEERNIELTLIQLRNTVTDQDLMLKSVLGTIQNFDNEVFASHKVAKGCIKDIKQIINDNNS